MVAAEPEGLADEGLAEPEGLAEEVFAEPKGLPDFFESINADAFMGIPFVCPPMIVQSEIVRYIYEKKKYIYQQQEKAKQLRIQAITDFESKIFD